MKKLTVFLIFLMLTGCLKQYEVDQINVGVPVIQGTAETAKVCKTFIPIKDIQCFSKGDLKKALIIGLKTNPDTAMALNPEDYFPFEHAFGRQCAYYDGKKFALATTVSKDLLKRIYNYKYGFEKLSKDIEVLNKRKYVVEDKTDALYLNVFIIATSMLLVGFIAGKSF